MSNIAKQETMKMDDAERLGRLKPKEKVAIAIEMTDVCVRICADGVRAQNLGISEEELIGKLRERLEWTKRHQKKDRQSWMGS